MRALVASGTSLDPLVLMKVASLNPGDIMYIDTTYQNSPAHSTPSFPCAMGIDGAGVVQEVGPDVHKFKIGDRVAGVGQSMGSFAELSIFNEFEQCHVPSEMDCSWKSAFDRVNCIKRLSEAFGIKVCFD